MHMLLRNPIQNVLTCSECSWNECSEKHSQVLETYYLRFNSTLNIWAPNVHQTLFWTAYRLSWGAQINTKWTPVQF